jgi:Fur family ferric uptake transcriptional regulator
MNESDIRRLLSEVGLRGTYPRLALISELSRSHAHPKSAAELTATLSQFPRSTIYRSLEALENSGLIKSSMIKWVRRYELGDKLAPHHHHLTCIKCQRMIDFDSSKLEKRLELIANDYDYSLMSHVVELRGLCTNCQDNEDISPLSALSRKLRSVAGLPEQREPTGTSDKPEGETSQEQERP